MTATKKLTRYFSDYASYHKTPGNKVTHIIGINSIVIGLLGLLSNWTLGSEIFMGAPYFRLDCGILLLVAGMLWYLYLDWKLAIPFGLVLTGFYFLGRGLPTSANWSIFILGWVFQGIGHYVFEKNSPAFFKSLAHLLIGPLWIFARLIRYSN